MREKHVSVISLAIAVALFMSGCGASEPAPGLGPIVIVKKETIRFDEQNSILIQIPDGWKHEKRSGTPIPFTARTYDLVVTPPSENKALLQITIGPTENGEQISGLEFEELLYSHANQLIPNAVEETADFTDFSVPKGIGKYCILTDASQVGQKLEPEDYLYVALIFATYEKGCLLYATALFDEVQSEEIELMLNTVAGIEPAFSDRATNAEPVQDRDDSISEAVAAVTGFADKAGIFDTTRTIDPKFQVDADIISIGRLDDLEGYSIRTSSYNYKCKYADSLIQEALAEGSFHLEGNVEIEGINKTVSIVAYIGSDGKWYNIIDGKKAQCDPFAPASIILSIPVFISEIDEKYIKSYSKETDGDLTLHKVIFDGKGYENSEDLLRSTLNLGLLESDPFLAADDLVYTFSIDSKGTPKAFNLTVTVSAMIEGYIGIDSTEISVIYNSFENIAVDIKQYE